MQIIMKFMLRMHRLEFIRILLAYNSTNDFYLYQMKVKFVFLNYFRNIYRSLCLTSS
ncbi:hypothetical protein HanHA300_Chr08g0273651 [Helianthus annuus]|nr:hypothetical protein HanHA300_Chr08g0273651 [Helianthus annuus]KAJ0718631.1 hypothetical protein HanLR1_Chr08g0272751 [Helianthus annuus]